MRMSDIYQFVFSDRANIVPNPRLTEEQALNFIENKKIDIQQAFKTILVTEQVKNKFQSLLENISDQNENHTNFLLDALNLTDKIVDFSEAGNITMPDEGDISQQFQILNNKYKFFNDDNADNSINDYSILFKASKLTADFIEKNNTENDELAFVHAYKLLVLFNLNRNQSQNKGKNKKKKQGDAFKYINSYLKQHSNTKKPVHDALVHDLPLNEPPLQHLNEWRILIQKYGMKAIEYFKLAPQIELRLNRAPQDLMEAEKIASTITYPRANEDLEMASLFVKYQISDAVFNKCLELKKIRKTQDALPDVIIQGDAEHSGYYLVKLPIDDPRALILGAITKCCQSIGGDSETCVIDGITRQKNGFYVLLKAITKIKSKPIRNNKINYDHFEIAGQGYAWLSRNGNFTFDSWENLRPETDNIAVLLLEKFAKKITNENKDILRVTIGTGGRSPDIYDLSVVDRPEKIAEGVQYNDSKKQGLIYSNADNHALFQEKVTELIQGKFNKVFLDANEFKKFIGYEGLNGSYDIEMIDSLFLQPDSEKKWSQYLDGKLNDIKSFKLDDTNKQLHLLEMILFLNKTNYISNLTLNKMFAFYKKDKDSNEYIFKLIDLLQAKNILTESILIKLFDQTHVVINNLYSIFKDLAVDDILSKDNVELLLLSDRNYTDNDIHGIQVAIKTFIDYNNENIKISNQFFKRIISLSSDILRVFNSKLNKLTGKLKLKNETIFDLIIDESINNADGMIEAASCLANKNILSERNLLFMRDWIKEEIKASRPTHLTSIPAMVSILEILLKNNLFDTDLRYPLLNCFNFGPGIKDEITLYYLSVNFEYLKNHNQLNFQILDLLIKLPSISENRDLSLNIRKLAKIGLLDDKLINYIISYSKKNPKYANKALLAFLKLHDLGIKEDISLFLDFPYDPCYITYLIETIKMNGFHFNDYKKQIMELNATNPKKNRLLDVVYALKIMQNLKIKLTNSLFQEVFSSTNLKFFPVELQFIRDKYPKININDVAQFFLRTDCSTNSDGHPCGKKRFDRFKFLMEKGLFNDKDNLSFIFGHPKDECNATEVLYRLYLFQMLTKIHVKILSHSDNVLKMADLLIALDRYLSLRQAEGLRTPYTKPHKRYNSLWAKLSGMSQGIKESAVNKLHRTLAKEEIQFTDLELKALQNGRLKEIVATFSSILPDTLISQLPKITNIQSRHFSPLQF